MRILENKDGKVIVEMTTEEVTTICYVLEFAKGGVSSRIEANMLKIVGVLEGVIDIKT